MSRYSVSPPARADLKGVYRHVIQDSPAAVGRLRQLFHNTFRILARNPLMGERRPELGNDIRMFAAGSYVIFFRPSPRGISVVRVIHSARDLDKAWRES